MLPQLTVAVASRKRLPLGSRGGPLKGTTLNAFLLLLFLLSSILLRRGYIVGCLAGREINFFGLQILSTAVCPLCPCFVLRETNNEIRTRKGTRNESRVELVHELFVIPANREDLEAGPSGVLPS